MMRFDLGYVRQEPDEPDPDAWRDAQRDMDDDFDARRDADRGK